LHQAHWFAYLFMATKIAVSFSIASLSCNFFEKRFLAMKDRFAPVYREAPIASAPALLQVG
jgi:peptidoglycan/LPS O-acetylase OafA/YrhL